MSRRTFTTRITTPVSTSEASPLETTFALPQGTLVLIEVVIPSGHAGLTGLAIDYSGEHIFPWGRGTFLEGDDEVVSMDVGRPIGGSPVTIRTFNIDDTFGHDHLLRFVVTDPADELRRRVAPLPLAPTELDIPDADAELVTVPVVGDAGETAEEGAEIEAPA
jgi:hypothetical protein